MAVFSNDEIDSTIKYKGVHTMKRLGILLCFGLLLVVLAACGSSKDDDANASSTKGDSLEVSIEDASYILSGKDGGESIDEEADGGLLQIELLIKNTSDSSIDVFPEMHMQLYDEDDNQIDPNQDYHHALDLGSSSTNSSIGSGKQKTVSVLFNVEKDKEYEINIAPMPSDYETELEDIIVPLDTSEYSDTLDTLLDPGIALEAYIETIYFDKKNKNFEELVSADRKELQNEAKDKFGERLEMDLYSLDLSDKDVKKYYEGFKRANGDKAEIETEVIGNANGKAIVTLNYSAIPFDNISKGLKKYKDEQNEKNDLSYDPEEEAKYALSKFDKILKDASTKSGNQEIEVRMKQEDGTWAIDDSDFDSTESIRRVFAEGSVR